MADLSEEDQWYADEGLASEVERRVAPLKTAAGATFIAALVAMFVGPGLLYRAETTVDASIWSGLVITALGLVLVICAGLSATAYWACKALLGSQPE